MNSAKWIGNVKMKVSENKIYVTAMSCMPMEKPSYYGNHLDLGYLKDGRYQLIYLDPDGTGIPIKEIIIDNKWTEQEMKIQRQNSNGMMDPRQNHSGVTTRDR